jgi:hypothetical protein
MHLARVLLLTKIDDRLEPELLQKVEALFLAHQAKEDREREKARDGPSFFRKSKLFFWHTAPPQCHAHRGAVAVRGARSAGRSGMSRVTCVCGGQGCSQGKQIGAPMIATGWQSTVAACSFFSDYAAPKLSDCCAARPPTRTPTPTPIPTPTLLLPLAGSGAPWGMPTGTRPGRPSQSSLGDITRPESRRWAQARELARDCHPPARIPHGSPISSRLSQAASERRGGHSSRRQRSPRDSCCAAGQRRHGRRRGSARCSQSAAHRAQAQCQCTATAPR